MRHGGCVVVVLAAGVAFACGGDQEGASRVTVRDSAGIEIVENWDTSGTVPKWTVGDDPVVDIGVEEGPEEYQLFRVAGACRLGVGFVAVLNAGTHEVRLFDQAGVFLRSFGRRGEGPGEFQRPWPMWCLPGDSLMVWDERLRRLTLFNADGEYARQTRIDNAAANPMVLGLFDDASFLVTDERWEIPESGFVPAHMTVVRYSAAGELTDSVANLPNGLVGQLGDVGLVGGPLFSTRAITAQSHDRFWSALGEEYEIGVYRPDGSLLRLIRWIGPDRAVRPEDTDAYWDERFETWGEEQHQRLNRMRQVTPVSGRFPAHSRFFGDRLGNLWVYQYPRPRDAGPRHCWVFDGGGRMIATALVPEGMRVMDYGDDFLLVVERDEMDVQHVRMYELVKP